jgi:hypothetical protein
MVTPLASISRVSKVEGRDIELVLRSLRLMMVLLICGNNWPVFPAGYYFGRGGIGLLGPPNLMASGPKIGLQFTKVAHF